MVQILYKSSVFFPPLKSLYSVVEMSAMSQHPLLANISYIDLPLYSDHGLRLPYTSLGLPVSCSVRAMRTKVHTDPSSGRHRRDRDIAIITMNLGIPPRFIFMKVSRWLGIGMEGLTSCCTILKLLHECMEKIEWMSAVKLLQ